MARKKKDIPEDVLESTSVEEESIYIDAFAEPAYLAYSMKTVKDRAIPDVEDGLKPVHRRILYAMDNLKLLPQNAKPMKSARIVGSIIGLYHPHGDQAVYDTMVRMSQPFSLRYPLVHGEGNFGSRDGDGAAAMRYTEARLAPIAAALLDELDYNAVDRKSNYDNTTTEPVSLPSRLPFLMLNGSFGVAVGMATTLPSHHLEEVVGACKVILQKKTKTTFEDIFEHIKGPDFATGAQIISQAEDIQQAYRDGKGAVRVRATWKVENYGKNNKDWRIAIKEIPPAASTAKVLEEIGALLDPAPSEKNGKKQPLKPEQLRLKKFFGDMIDRAVDASDKNEAVNIIIEPKNRNVDADVLMSALCAHTGLEANVSINLVAVDLSGVPRQGNLLEWLSQWCDYRVHTVFRRTTDQKERVDSRLHIVEGRLTILDHLDEVIHIIRTSDTPKEDLIKRFNLSDIQAEDVLETRLRSLANLEGIKLKEEREKLSKESARLGKLLADDKALRKLIISELDQDLAQFGKNDGRRTLLAPQEASARSKQAVELTSVSLAPEPVGIVLTERGWLGWRPSKNQEDALAGDYKVKTGDSVKRSFFGDRAQYLMLLSLKGRAYSMRMTDLPNKQDMVPLTQFFDVEPGDRFVDAWIGDPESVAIVAGSSGNGFIIRAKNWINRMKAGKVFLSMSDDEHPLQPLPFDESSIDKDTTLIALATDGRFVAFPLTDMKELGKGKGLAFMGFAKGESLSDIALHSKANPAILRAKKGKDITLPHADIEPSISPRSSSRKGKLLHKNGAGSFVRISG